MTFLPIVERELRVGSRKRSTYWLRSVTALAVILIFLCSAFGRGYGSTAERAQEMFVITSALVLAGCLFAGVFLTADCLSSEKRNGTLGLLFLTDLRGYDVVLGKLASASLAAVYGLLSILPVLGLPLLMGGVTGGEFWRIVLVLIVAVFFSLVIGMVASAFVRETRQALALTALIILVLVAVLPAIQSAATALRPNTHLPDRVLLWPGLGYAFREALDNYYKSSSGRLEYWGSLLTVFCLSGLCLLAATFILPRVWREKTRPVSHGSRFWHWLRFRSAGRRRKFRAALLGRNPYYWLAVRDRLPRIGSGLLLVLVVPLWLAFFLGAFVKRSTPWYPGYEFIFLTVFGLGVLFKCLAAAEASRRLSDDRQSGALEILLVTPLSERRMIAGQRRALWRHFWPPIFIILLLFSAIIWMVYGPNPMHEQWPEFGVLMSGNAAALFADFYAIGWLGLWLGLRARTHTRAVLGTIARVLFIPWLLYFLMGFSGCFDGLGAPVGIGIWFLFGVVNDLFWVLRARRRLRREFRACAAGITRKPRRLRAPALPQPAAA